MTILFSHIQVLIPYHGMSRLSKFFELQININFYQSPLKQKLQGS
jgi:hypothetical protein